MKIRNTENNIQAFFFVVVVAALAMVSGYNCFAHHQTGEVSAIENRTLADLPSHSMAKTNFQKFVSLLEQFYNDRFACRLDLQKTRSLILYKLLETSSSPLVVLGKNGWMFYFTENLATNDAFNVQQLQNWTQLVQSRHDFLAEHGIKYILMIVPEKGTIEPELLSDSLQNLPRASRYKQLRDYLPGHSNTETVDLLPVFEKDKDKPRLYYKTDSHWTDTGAMLAGNALANKLKPSFPDVSSNLFNHLKFVERDMSGDLAKMLNLQGIIFEPSSSLDHSDLTAVASSGRPDVFENHLIKSEAETVSRNKSLPTAFVLHDSFTLGLQPFLSEFFSKAKFHWYQALPIQEVIAYHPDVVIQEMAERNLYNLGSLDEFSLGTYPYYPVKQSLLPPAPPISKALAEFVDGECIDFLNFQKQGNELSVEIDWHIQKEHIPNQIIGIHAIDQNDKIIASADYAQNPSYSVFGRQMRWRDSVVLKVPPGLEPVKIGVVMYRTKDFLSKVKAKVSDWGSSRALFLQTSNLEGIERITSNHHTSEI
ncbi:MAG: hypothetical protein P4L53_21275 [Candidatus Obscuribacterales bacterium]|nr:hypothetical protein [Candidatus Obscuribacterales bacterium]